MSVEGQKIVAGEASETDEESETLSGSLKESIENVSACPYHEPLLTFP